MDRDDINWSLTTWQGSRREQLRRWRALSVRERLQAIEAMAELARVLSAGRTGGASVDVQPSGKQSESH